MYLSKRAKIASQNFHWIKPNLQDVEAKIQDAFLKEGISFDAIPNSFNNGKLIPLDRKIWNKLNTENLNVDKWNEIEAFVKKYNKLPAPTVLELNNHNLILIAGNLQLAYARANLIKPWVYWIKETEIFKSPHSLD